MEPNDELVIHWIEIKLRVNKCCVITLDVQVIFNGNNYHTYPSVVRVNSKNVKNIAQSEIRKQLLFLHHLFELMWPNNC